MWGAGQDCDLPFPWGAGAQIAIPGSTTQCGGPLRTNKGGLSRQSLVSERLLGKEVQIIQSSDAAAELAGVRAVDAAASAGE